jgi:hypothetical protein
MTQALQDAPYPGAPRTGATVGTEAGMHDRSFAPSTGPTGSTPPPPGAGSVNGGHPMLVNLVRSADPVTVFTSLAGKLVAMGYRCLIEIVEQERGARRIVKSPPAREAESWADLTLLIESSPTMVCDGRVVGVGFVGDGDLPFGGFRTGAHESALAGNDSSIQHEDSDESGTHDRTQPGGVQSAFGHSGAPGWETPGGYAGALVARRLRGGRVTEADAEVVHALVTYAVGVVAAERLRGQLEDYRTRVEQLERALRDTRDVGLAIGTLMAARRCSAEEAVVLLQAASQTGNGSLADIAAQLARTGDLPANSPRAGRTGGAPVIGAPAAGR